MKKAVTVFLLLSVLVSAFALNAAAEEAPSADAPQSTAEASIESSEASIESAEVSAESAEASVESAEVSAESSETSSDGVINFTFSTSRFPTALKHMAVGMLGVLIVLGLIAVVVFILNRVSRPKK